MKKHTQGPLTYSKSQGYIGTSRGVICQMASSAGTAGIGNNIPYEEQEANAKLFTLAPDIAELLREMLVDQETLAPSIRNEALCEKARGVLGKLGMYP